MVTLKGRIKMSKFIKLTTSKGNSVLLNVDKIIDVYCKEDGRAIITIGVTDDGYEYPFDSFEAVERKIMEATR